MRSPMSIGGQLGGGLRVRWWSVCSGSTNAQAFSRTAHGTNSRVVLGPRSSLQGGSVVPVAYFGDGRVRGSQTEHEWLQEQLQREQHPVKGSRKKTLPEQQLVKIVKKGLSEGIARFVYAMDILTEDELHRGRKQLRTTRTRLIWTATELWPPGQAQSERGPIL